MHTTRSRVGALGVLALAATTSLALGAGAPATATGDGSPTGRSSEPASGSAPRPYAHRAAAPGLVKLDLLGFNDFHGNLEVVDPSSFSGLINNTPAGGVAYLASVLRHERQVSRAAGAVPVTVAAGDLIGASPLLSAAFHDEPTIKAMNRVGLQVSAVGNHEFDEGWRELRRMARGGCLDDGPDGENGQNSCPGGQGFRGADFPYLGANVRWQDPSGHPRRTVFPATKVLKVHGVKVGFIGMTLQGTAAIVSKAGIQGIRFADEVKTANELVPQLRARGVQSIVVLLHEGVVPTDPTAYNDCTGVTGEALRIAQDLKPEIDAVVSGHTHQPYNCLVEDPKGRPRLLTSAASYGRMVSKLHLLIDPRSGDVVRPAEYAENLIVENDASVEPDADLLDLIDTYRTLVEPIANEVIGHIAPGTQTTRTADPDGGDSPLGNLTADAQKADPSVVAAGGEAPVVALMNPGGIRTDLVEDAAGNLTYGAAFAAQPFNNFVVSMDLTGAQLEAVLNEQWNGENETAPKILQVSGLSYTWDASEAAAAGADALVGEVLIDEDGDPATALVPVEAAATYRVVVNSFLADGGDNFVTLTEGTDRFVGGLDIDALRAYLETHDPVSATPTDRISQRP